MKKLIAFLFLSLLMAGCVDGTQNKIADIPSSLQMSTQANAQTKPKINEELLTLSAQFKAARIALKNHKPLYPESESPQIKQAIYEYTALLQTFAKKLGTPLYTRDDIIMLMGEPDNIFYQKNSTTVELSYDVHPGLNIPEELLFVCENGLIKEAHFASV